MLTAGVPEPVRSVALGLSDGIVGFPGRLVQRTVSVFVNCSPAVTMLEAVPLTVMVMTRPVWDLSRSKLPMVDSVNPVAAEPVNWKLAFVNRPRESETVKVGDSRTEPPPGSIGSGSEKVVLKASVVLFAVLGNGDGVRHGAAALDRALPEDTILVVVEFRLDDGHRSRRG